MIAGLDSIQRFHAFCIRILTKGERTMANDIKGISTYQTYLMYRTTTNGSYDKLIDITSFPDLIPPKERIDITSLSDYMRRR